MILHYLLWALQVVLATKLVSVPWNHGIRPDLAKMQPGAARFGRAMRPLLAVVAVATLLGAAGLILPPATDILAWLTPWAAAFVALLMLVATGLHTGCREKPMAVVDLILFALAAFVAYGRWALAPL
jgi:hypothetical protein